MAVLGVPTLSYGRFGTITPQGPKGLAIVLEK